ncbi:hypothetical protein CHCC14427_2777 [Bacillus paralicheniformis]|nr:hypothetical protein CHCC14427_2777 [Bacillus paralicheniformis]
MAVPLVPADAERFFGLFPEPGDIVCTCFQKIIIVGKTESCHPLKQPGRFYKFRIRLPNRFFGHTVSPLFVSLAFRRDKQDASVP